MRHFKFITVKLYDGNAVKKEIGLLYNGWLDKYAVLPDGRRLNVSVRHGKEDVFENQAGDIITGHKPDFKSDMESDLKSYNLMLEKYDIDVFAEDGAEQISAGLTLKINDWPADNYVFAPGAVYNGNRFPVYPSKYPHIRCDTENYGPGSIEMISDIPRLEDSVGCFQFHAGDMAAPFLGFADLSSRQGLLLYSPHKIDGIETGFFFRENMLSGVPDSLAEAAVMIPGVKEKVNYIGGSTSSPSDDQAISLQKGGHLRHTVYIYTFTCSNIQSLYDVFYFARKRHTNKDTYDLQLPFGKALAILEKKFNEEDWNDDYGYYSIGSRENHEKAWILGWPGIMMYPMLLNGQPDTIKRALRNIDYVINKTCSPMGFFYASAGGDDCFGDHFHDRKLKNWLLVRRNCDALYYLVKCLQIIETEKIVYDTENLRKAIRGCADALSGLWNRYGQIGQFIDADNGNIIIGSTSSGALSAGALALCGAYLYNPVYIKTACEIAEYYYIKYVGRGITNGGPGEILQAPDSESSYAIVISYVSLYSITKDKKWLKRSEEAARQFSSWCMPYNYEFPVGSEFGRLNMKTAGTVFANVQNKHSAPGICTHSGFELFQLFRYTGDISYLELIKDIAGTIPQYLSVEGRLINTRRGGTLLHGWMHERVNTCDWEGKKNIGTVGAKNCWCSISLMKTCAEIPGIYIQPDTKFYFVIDHMKVINIKFNDKSIEIEIGNPTEYDAEITVYIENKCNITPDISILPLSYKRLLCKAQTSLHYKLYI